MLLIDCPHCGPRDEVEFHYGGQAGVDYPRDPQALDDRAWSEYLFVRDSPAGPFAERWAHTAGCRKWFVAVRDTVTYAFLPTGADGAVRADGAAGAAGTGDALSTASTDGPDASPAGAGAVPGAEPHTPQPSATPGTTRTDPTSEGRTA